MSPLPSPQSSCSLFNMQKPSCGGPVRKELMPGQDWPRLRELFPRSLSEIAYESKGMHQQRLTFSSHRIAVRCERVGGRSKRVVGFGALLEMTVFAFPSCSCASPFSVLPRRGTALCYTRAAWSAAKCKAAVEPGSNQLRLSLVGGYPQLRRDLDLEGLNGRHVGLRVLNLRRSLGPRAQNHQGTADVDLKSVDRTG